MQCEIYKKQEQKCNIWLGQNLILIKTSALMFMTKQMIENRDWKEVRGLTENILCRLFSN